MSSKPLTGGGMTTDAKRLESARGAFDAFIGFIYATSIALLLGYAHGESEFTSPISVVLTLFLLMFFAQDWLIRWQGRQRWLEKTGKTQLSYILRLCSELAIVYFLLLASLKLIEIYSPLTLSTIAPVGQRHLDAAMTMLLDLFSHSGVGYMVAAFAIMSGLWNSVMITVSERVNKDHIRSIFTGHLQDEIIELFPRIKQWIRDYRDNVDSRLRTSTDPSLARLLAVVLRSLVKNPHHLLVPYLFVFHVVALNYVLGVLILLSDLLLQKGAISDPSLLFHCILPCVLVVLALLLLAVHFSSAKRPIHIERLACSFTATAIILLYSALPMPLLVVCVVVQQVLANVAMNTVFSPSRIAVKAAEAEATP